MLVKDIMNQNVKTCLTGDSIENAAKLMMDFNKGFIPVIDNKQHVTGVITDRDIVMHSVSKHKPLWDLKSQDIIKNRPLFTCKPEDDVETALRTMSAQKLHRLPVTDKEGKIKGVLGLAEILEASAKDKTGKYTADHTLQALKGVFND